MWTVDDACVVHERLDDEVIAIALETGVYYSLRGAAAEIWTALVAGADDDAITQVLVERFDVDEATARTDGGAFLGRLRDEGLIVPGGAPTRAERGGERRAYSAPVLERFDDMQELLLLDPIHEVDDAGWPIPAPEAG